MARKGKQKKEMQDVVSSDSAESEAPNDATKAIDSVLEKNGLEIEKDAGQAARN